MAGGMSSAGIRHTYHGEVCTHEPVSSESGCPLRAQKRALEYSNLYFGYRPNLRSVSEHYWALSTS